MAVTFWPIILLSIRDVLEDLKYAEKDIRLGLYSRTVYILVQVNLFLEKSNAIYFSIIQIFHKYFCYYRVY